MDNIALVVAAVNETREQIVALLNTIYDLDNILNQLKTLSNQIPPLQNIQYMTLVPKSITSQLTEFKVNPAAFFAGKLIFLLLQAVFRFSASFCEN